VIALRVLIIGGTGSFSSRVTEKAFARGHEVMVYARGKRPLLGVPRAASRGDRGVRLLAGERGELRARAAEIREFAPDVVVDSLCFDPARAQDLVELFSGVRRVVLISSVDVYGEDVGVAPVTEERAPNPVTPYAKGKLASEQIVLAGLGARATVFRPSHILGRTFLTTSLWGRSPYVVDRMRQGKHIPAIDGGRNLVTPVHAVDVAEWVVRSFDTPAADGEVFNAVGGVTTTQRHYYECIAKALGVELRLVAVPSHVFRRHSNAASQFNWHRPYSCAKAARVLGYAPLGTPEVMLAETVEYMLEHGLVKDCSEHPIDDALVDVALRHEAELGEVLASKAG
jgi:nucleoside-diphosphate-sugar epimerase